MKMRYWFKIGRDYGNSKEFSVNVNSVEEAILVENVVCEIANDEILGIEDSVGGLVTLDNDGDWVDYMDPETYEEFDEIKEEKEELSDKRPGKLRMEIITKKFVDYLGGNLNYNFFARKIERKLEVYNVSEKQVD